MSQYGEIEDINLVRDENSGKSKGFCFLKYEDARSCVLAVDNLSGAEVCGRSLRVDHVENYRLPKHLQEQEDGKQQPTGPGHAYSGQEFENEFSLLRGQDLFAPVSTDGGDENVRRQRKDERRRLRELKEVRKREKMQRKAEREERRRRKRAKRKHVDKCSSSRRRSCSSSSETS